MVEKVDLKREMDSYRASVGEFRLLRVPPLRYLMIDGHGDPNTAAEYRRALETLYPVAYKLKFASKRELERDYVVPPLEGLWWADDMTSFTSARDKSAWHWTLMLLVPDWMPDDMVDAAIEAATGVLARMHDEIIPGHGMRPRGTHHEIYLSDARRVAPEKLRTILRQPVEPA